MSMAAASPYSLEHTLEYFHQRRASAPVPHDLAAGSRAPSARQERGKVIQAENWDDLKARFGKGKPDVTPPIREQA